jgi:nucleotide-binding universal stress UspA family protein
MDAELMAAAPPTRPRVVIGVDGSDSSHTALRWAAREASTLGARLDVVHAWRVPFPTYADGGPRDPTPFRKAAQATLDQVKSWLDELDDLDGGSPDVHLDLVEHNAASAVLEAAAGAELLVVGSRGRGGFKELLLGSVSRRCVQLATGPVAVVPAGWDERGGGRVVIGVDGSDGSYEALHWATQAATRHHAQLDGVNDYEYLQCVSPDAPAMVDLEPLEQSSRSLLEEMVAGAVPPGEPGPANVRLIPCVDSAASSLIGAAKGGRRDGGRSVPVAVVASAACASAPSASSARPRDLGPWIVRPGGRTMEVEQGGRP